MKVRSWLRLVIALATILVGAGMARPGDTSARLLSPLADAVLRTADGQVSSERSHHWQNGSSRPLGDLRSVESDLDDDDDDDDRLSHGVQHSASSARDVSAPRRPPHTLRADRGADPSRFDAGIAHPRGPPA